MPNYPRPGAAAVATEATRQRVHQLLQAVVDSVTQLSTPVLQEVYHPLMAAQMELEFDLVRLLKTMPNGADSFTAHRMRSALRQIRGALEAIDKVAPVLREGLIKGAFEAAGLSNQWLSKEMARLAAAFGEDMPQLDLLTIEKVMQRNSWLIARYDRAAVRYTEGAKSALRNQFAIGVARNETIDQLTNRIMRLTGRGNAYGLTTSDVAEKMAEGLFKGRYSDAERLVRTEMQNTYNAHHQRAIEEAGLMKRWDATADRRLCFICRELDGEVKAADEEFASGQMYPPRHPNCRCILVPWKEGWPELTQLPPVEERNANRVRLAGAEISKPKK